MFHLSLYPVFDSYLLVAVVAVVLAALMGFGPSRERTSRRQRLALLVLRVAVIALVLLAMLRPTLVYTRTSKQPATLVLLIDGTRSMTVPDAVGKTTRWEAMRAGLAAATPALQRLSQEFELKAYLFDADLHELPVDHGKIRLPDRPTGDQTAIGAAIDDVLRASRASGCWA